jgi:hypothetical protein
MSNSIYNQMMSQGGNRYDALMQRIGQLKKMVSGDPMQQVQMMLNSGKITQAQYNDAVQKANAIMKAMHQ